MLGEPALQLNVHTVGRTGKDAMINPEKRILLDPDGTWTPGWLVVVVAGRTGVRYEQQCCGVACDVREVEGYLVPLGGLKYRSEDGLIDTAEFRSVFHLGDSCSDATGERLPPRQKQRLRELVAAVPYWVVGDNGKGDAREHLTVDDARLGELAEAWVPVTTPDGPGVLMWDNCD